MNTTENKHENPLKDLVPEVIEPKNQTHEEWEDFASWLGSEYETEAAEKFKETPESHYLDNVDAIFDALTIAIKTVRDGRAPLRLSDFASKELKKILAVKTWTECVKFCVNDDLTDEEYKTASSKTILDPYIDDAWTDQYGLWRQVVVALAAFLREAAALAKRVGSVDAARRFILAWRTADRFENSLFEHMSQGEANDLVDALNDAANILWADMELAKL